MANLKNKTIQKIEEIEKEISIIDFKLQKILNKNEKILVENTRNYKQLKKEIQQELKTEKIITKFENILNKLFLELQNYFRKIIEESKQTNTKQLYEKYEQELEQLIKQEIKTFEQIKQDIIEWDKTIENIRLNWLNEAKKGTESKRDITQYRRMEIHETNVKLYSQIKNLSTIITRLQEYDENIQKELGAIKETRIEIKLHEIRLKNKLIIIDTNFFKVVANVSKNSQLIITEENLRGHNIIIPNKVVSEAISTQNSHNRGLVPRKVVSYIANTIEARYENLEYEATYKEEEKLKKAVGMIPRKKRPTLDNFKKSADAQILIYIWRNPHKKITVITNDGDFNRWDVNNFLGEAIAVSANRSFKIVA